MDFDIFENPEPEPQSEKEKFDETVNDIVSVEWSDGVADLRETLPVIRKFDAELAGHLEAMCREAEECRDLVKGRKS